MIGGVGVSDGNGVQRRRYFQDFVRIETVTPYQRSLNTWHSRKFENNFSKIIFESCESVILESSKSCANSKALRTLRASAPSEGNVLNLLISWELQLLHK